MKKILIVAFFILFGILAFANHNVIVVHTSGGNHGFDQISIEPPHVTYDDDLNELYVYFGSTGTIDLEYLDPTGMPCTSSTASHTPATPVQPRMTQTTTPLLKTKKHKILKKTC